MANGDQGEREDPAKAADQAKPAQLGEQLAGLAEPAAIAAAMAEIAAIGAAAPGDEPGLPLEDDAGDDADLIAKAAETTSVKRRARGRPKGSANLRNDALFDWLEARGMKNPVVRLMEIISADPRDLAKALGHPGGDRSMGDQAREVFKVQVAAATALLPYVVAKKPQVLEVDKRTLHVFLAGALGGNADITDRFDVMHQIEENQALSADAPEKSHDESRTDGGKPSDNSDIDHK